MSTPGNYKKKAEEKGAKGYIKFASNKIVDYENGTYLIELDEFVKLANGKMAYKPIKQCCGLQIKFNKNGVHYFSVWKGSSILEDRIMSIKDAERIAKELSSKNESMITKFDQFVNEGLVNDDLYKWLMDKKVKLEDAKKELKKYYGDDVEKAETKVQLFNILQDKEYTPQMNLTFLNLRKTFNGVS